MEQFFSSGRAVDLILAFMALEFAVLVFLRRAGFTELSVADVAALMLPGFFLLLALKAALTGAAWSSIAALLFASLVAHLGDLWRRQKSLQRGHIPTEQVERVEPIRSK